MKLTESVYIVIILQVVQELQKLESQNSYQALVFLILPHQDNDTTQIECVVSAEDTRLKTVDISEVMRRIQTSSAVTDFMNLEANVSSEGWYYIIQGEGALPKIYLFQTGVFSRLNIF